MSYARSASRSGLPNYAPANLRQSIRVMSATSVTIEAVACEQLVDNHAKPKQRKGNTTSRNARSGDGTIAARCEIPWLRREFGPTRC